MTRALVVFAHPTADSFSAAIRDTVVARLTKAGAAVRLHDLYAQGFDPVLSAADWAGYGDAPGNRAGVARYADDLLWCDTLIFVYPTWWGGLPAILKGWLDRVLLPGVAFAVPDGASTDLRPTLRHITGLGVFTTGGAGRWVTLWMGAPGKRTLLTWVGALCARRRRTVFAALYAMDTITPATRARHLARVGARVDRLIRRG